MSGTEEEIERHTEEQDHERDLENLGSFPREEVADEISNKVPVTDSTESLNEEGDTAVEFQPRRSKRTRRLVSNRVHAEDSEMGRQAKIKKESRGSKKDPKQTATARG